MLFQENLDNTKDKIIILGGGLAGLSAGYVLTRAGLSVKVFESDSSVGGLSKTIVHNGFRFDLGGHRFFTKNRELNDFLKGLMGEELISVPRKSKIYMRNKYFDYPLKPFNAIFGLGVSTTMEILVDYAAERIKRLVKNRGVFLLRTGWSAISGGRCSIYTLRSTAKRYGVLNAA